MVGLLPVLRQLARPLAALGIVLTFVATVLPVVARADGSWCIGTLGALDPNASASPIGDGCVPIAVEAALPAELAPRERLRPEVPLAALFSLVALAPEAERIRGPPAR